MTAYSPDAWESFFIAQAGAAAALSGLLFVGVSINVQTIVSATRLVRRALEAFVLLVEVLILSALALVPDASRTALGCGLLGASVLAWAIVSRLHLQALATVQGSEAAAAPRGSVPVQIFLGQAGTVLFVIGAITLIAESGGGLYWFAPGVVFAFVAALVEAWVLLIEIQR
jgi:modulator of FtsH protease